MSPGTGTALSTSFAFLAQQFQSDAAVLPLLYGFGFRLTSQSAVTNLKQPADPSSSLTTTLTSGSSDNGYSLLCVVLVYDQLGVLLVESVVLSDGSASEDRQCRPRCS